MHKRSEEPPPRDALSASCAGGVTSLAFMRRLLQERSEECKRQEARANRLERELDARDLQLRHLRNELDKYRQVVNPLTQKIIHEYDRVAAAADADARNAVLVGLIEPRIKRLAISAEPQPLSDAKVERVPKSNKYDG